MVVFSRKATVFYSSSLIALWLTFFLVMLLSNIFASPMEIRIAILIVVGLIISLYVPLGCYLSIRGMIPPELVLSTVLALILALITWGSVMPWTGFPLVLTVAASLPLNVFFLNPQTRERGAMFK